MAMHRIGEQLCLPEFEIDSPHTHRLLFVALPDESTARHISSIARDLKRKHRLHGDLLPSKRLHVSLFHVSDYYQFPHDIADRAKEGASGLVLPPIEIVLDRVMSFSGAQVYPPREDSYALVLLASQGATELAMLRKALALAMMKAGIRPRYSLHFKPHLTLLYDRRHRIMEDVEPIRWTVNEFVLIDSLVGKGRYKELGRWPLKGRFPVRSVSSPPEKIATIVGESRCG
jgi:RNA 2',3'-cyclic 3'-phosphodiesterase